MIKHLITLPNSEYVADIRVAEALDKLINNVPGSTLDEQFELINEATRFHGGMRLHTKRPGSMPFTF